MSIESDWRRWQNKTVITSASRAGGHLLCVDDLAIRSYRLAPTDWQLVFRVRVRQQATHRSTAGDGDGDGDGRCGVGDECSDGAEPVRPLLAFASATAVASETRPRQQTSTQLARLRSAMKTRVLSLVCHFTALLATLIAAAGGSSPVKVILPHDCGIDEFFNDIHMRCEECGSATAATTGTRPSQALDRNSTLAFGLVRSPSRLHCACAPGFFRSTSQTPDQTLRCERCPASSATSLDGLECAKCVPSETFDVTTQTCRCSNGVIQEGREAGLLVQRCVPCSGFTRRSESGDRCAPCHPSFVRNTSAASSSSSSCTCPPDRYKVDADLCLPKDELVTDANDAYLVKFKRKSVRSRFFAQHLQASVYGCKHLANRTSCQALASLCVLQHCSFTEDLLFGKSSACSEHRKLASGPAHNSQTWSKKTPWLYYSDDSRSELARNNVPFRFSVGSGVRFLAFRYDALGHWVDASELSIWQLFLCLKPGDTVSTTLVFGRNIAQTCRVPARSIWQSAASSPADVKLYDLFLLSLDGRQMYPVPVLNLDLEKDGERVNEGPGDSWQLIRRFFLSEAVAGIEDKNSPENHGSNKSAARFIQSLDMDIKLRETDGSGSVYPPLLTISYGEVSGEDVTSNRQVRLSLQVRFWTEQHKVERDVSVTVSVLCPIGVLWSVFQTWTWGKRCGRRALDLSVVLEFLLMSAGVIGLVFFLVGSGCCLSWFLFFKMQSVLHTLLPTPAQEYWPVLYVVIAFVLTSLKLSRRREAGHLHRRISAPDEPRALRRRRRQRQA